MALGTQAKLLRVLEDKEVIPVGANEPIPVDVRIVAATNRNLLARVQEGQFREDLFYRLAVVQVPLPGLRQRPEDIPDLVDYFIVQFEEQHGKQVRGVRPEVLEQLAAHVWPGNVRELRNVVETMVVLDVDGMLGLDDLPVMLRNLPRALPPAPEEGAADAPAELGPAAEEAEDVEAEIILSGGKPGAAPRPSAQPVEVLPSGTPPPPAPASSVPPAASPAPASPASASPPPLTSLVGRSLEEVERELILATLEAVGGNRAQAAKTLGIGERTLYRKLKSYQAEDEPA